MAVLAERFANGVSADGMMRYATRDEVDSATVTMDMLKSEHPLYIPARNAIKRRVTTGIFSEVLETNYSEDEQYWIEWYLDYYLKPIGRDPSPAEGLEHDQVEDFIIGRAIMDGLKQAARHRRMIRGEHG